MILQAPRWPIAIFRWNLRPILQAELPAAVLVAVDSKKNSNVRKKSDYFELFDIEDKKNFDFVRDENAAEY